MSKAILITGKFPSSRMRRNRQKSWSRKIISENIVTADDLIWPCFVRDNDISPSIDSFPNITRYTTDELLYKLEELVSIGIKSVMLFPVISMGKRDAFASEALKEQSLVINTIKVIKKNFPNIGIITDVALDQYTCHGQDGLIINDIIDNDKTLEIIEKHALLQAHAGADIIGPSEMMDGRVGRIRTILDNNNLQQVGIMSYAAKFASCLYSPFRDALQSKSLLGGANKLTYQMDPGNSDEAMREVSMDIQEGADMIIIKPGLPYLDIVSKVRESFKIPTIAFHVSAEYAMLRVAANAGIINYEEAIKEIAICFKRAGCSAIISYAAPDIAYLAQQQGGGLKIVA